MKTVPIAEAHNRLSALLKRLRKGAITLTSHGKPVGVLLAPEEYERLLQFEAYGQIERLSRSLKESGLTARELYQVSRHELEDRS